MRKTIAIAIMTGLMLSSTGALADYFQYVEEHRKPGQTVEEARKEQMEQYREAMNKKYEWIERQNERRKAHKTHKAHKAHKAHKEDVAKELGLSDEQKSFMKKIHQERRDFMKKKREEIRAFHEQKENEFLDSLNLEQKANFQKMKKSFHKKYMPKDRHHSKKFDKEIR